MYTKPKTRRKAFLIFNKTTQKQNQNKTWGTKSTISKTVTVGALILTLFQGGTVHAIGKNPAFDHKVKNDKEVRDSIVRAVSGELDKLIPLSSSVFEQTEAYKRLHKNYKNVGYPSENKGNEEGMREDNKIDVNSVKKPITEPSKIQLAEQVRYYQFNFTSGLHYTGIEKTSRFTNDFEQKSKLNYFDYIALIDSIKNNPSYTDSVKEKKLTQVEQDLQNSIDMLYGGKEFTGSLKAMESIKSVSIPFNYNKYSYLQLLAAYQKDKAINSTLSYYSELIDTLDTIRLYSAGVRQKKDVSINSAVLADRINQKYNQVQQDLIEPVVAVVGRNEQEEDSLKAGESFEKEQLNKEFNIQN